MAKRKNKTNLSILIPLCFAVTLALMAMKFFRIDAYIHVFEASVYDLIGMVFDLSDSKFGSMIDYFLDDDSKLEMILRVAGIILMPVLSGLGLVASCVSVIVGKNKKAANKGIIFALIALALAVFNGLYYSNQTDGVVEIAEGFYALCGGYVLTIIVSFIGRKKR